MEFERINDADIEQISGGTGNIVSPTDAVQTNERIASGSDNSAGQGNTHKGFLSNMRDVIVG